jgi:hypothetical protein
MGNVFNLTENDFPPSAVFIDFLARFLDASGFTEERWHDQLCEQLSGAPRKMRERAGVQLERLALDATARAAIGSA